MALLTWAFKRQIFDITIILLLFGFFAFLIIYPSFNKAPTCTDGLQNGQETGVDCGGSCVRACFFEADAVSTIWARSFLVVPGRYNALAYLENHNRNLVVNKIKYTFRFADKDNVYLGRREGIAFIPPGRSFAIFERGIELGSSSLVYTTFEFNEVPNWVTILETKINQLQVYASDVRLENEDTTPHLSATINNNSLFIIPDVTVVAILYDENHNAVDVSSTYLEELGGEEERVVDFTWPMPFKSKIVTKEIIPVFNMLKVKLK